MARLDGLPDIGTRDLAQIRTLLSILFRWGVERHLAHLYFYWSSAATQPAGGAPRPSNPRIVEAPGKTPEGALSRLIDFVSRILALIFTRRLELADPSSSHASDVRQTHVTKVLLTRHATPILQACIFLGWASSDTEIADTSLINQDTYKRSALRILTLLPPSQAFSSLGSIISNTSSPPPPHVKKSCASLLSEQLLRPGGLRGLFDAIFGEEATDNNKLDAPLAKLEYSSRILGAVPSQMTRKDYYSNIIPRLLSILSPESQSRLPVSTSAPSTPESHRRGASFAISRMLRTQPSLAASILLPILHGPFIHVASQDGSINLAHGSSPSTDPRCPTVDTSLGLMTALLTHTDPSPALLHALLTPILPPLSSLVFFLDAHPGIVLADPNIKDIVRSLIKTWARVVDREQALQALWATCQGAQGWGMDLENDMLDGRQYKEWARIDTCERSDITSLSEPASSPLDLRPDPVRLVGLLKYIDQKELSGALFVRTLDEYRTLRDAGSGVHPMRTLLHLNLIMEMVDQLGSTILTQTDHILSFIAHALEPSVIPTSKPPNSGKPKGNGLSLDDLKFVEPDSDDEEEEEGDGGNDMVFTAVNLLLSILEANPSITPANTPLLKIIASHLEPLANHPSQFIRQSASEVRLILKARLASDVSISAPDTDSPARKSALETYQEALKLVQDPILPVRAHGLLLLRHLIVPPTSRAGKAAPEPIEPALVPAILDVFMQAVQDDDSFIFLNAVQGLSAMVDRLGKDILKGLVDVYSRGIDGTGADMPKHELDKRLRIGEALGQVARRYGDALALCVDTLVPPLLQIIRSFHLPTALRTSAISVLAQCTETSSFSILPWSTDLVSAMLDLLRLETVSARPKEAKHEAEASTTDGRISEPMDSTPLSTSPKLAPFRRAALHFLTLVIRSAIADVYGGNQTSNPFDPGLASHARTVLSYISSTDVDGIVRVQAREALDMMKQYEKAKLGLE
ncbi:hypothetical protein BOTBODRAFT_624950 [Botryobasidium botryosum FD-172 SS1]|uniref:Uncharacterized protein n=1 Tax=Botryobasidium botryosum (strain FD-172 SS1) TaxID=930990 RepID=A0A067MU47_BOTB1|nr:hypothetical protein BOTBODRAFT_624950 [Botryobasidium botryosum FD-172 SS1]